MGDEKNHASLTRGKTRIVLASPLICEGRLMRRSYEPMEIGTLRIAAIPAEGIASRERLVHWKLAVSVVMNPFTRQTDTARRAGCHS